CSGDCKAPTNGCKNDSRRGSTPWSKLGRTSASFSSSSSRIRKRRSIDPSPFSGFLPLKKLIQQILTAAQVRDTVELGGCGKKGDCPRQTLKPPVSVPVGRGQSPFLPQLLK